MTSPAPPESLLAIKASRDATRALERHRSWLDRHETLAETLADAGRAEDAAAIVAVGANVAMYSHPGVMASPRMEAVLWRIARERLEPLPARSAVADPKRVLHVATETYGVGGHTRVLWRWIARDPERTHTVVTTAQRAAMPDGLAAAVAASGGRVVALPHHAPLLERAAAVRALAAEADVVVLHAHPFDPVPTLAFAAAGGRPPVILFDHGAHLFWLGRSIADLVQGGPDELPTPTARRGIPAERYAGVPFPVAGSDGHGRDAATPLPEDERAAARERILGGLGWPADTVLLTTVGAAYKYEGPRGVGLLDLVMPVLRANPHARLLAAGPADAGRWREARERTGGRVLALGDVNGLGPVYSAADVYLDSRPFGGNGAASEAASHGLPVLGCAPTPLEGVISCATPIFGAHQAAGAAAFRAELQQLIDRPERRTELGERARATVAATDASWDARVSELYRRAAALGQVDPDALAIPDDAPEPVDVLVHLQNEATGRSWPAARVEPLLAQLELAVGSPALRALFVTLAGAGWLPEQRQRYRAALATPTSAPDELRAVVAELRRLSLAGFVAEELVIALRPQDAEAAVPVLEDAIGDDFTVDLVLDPEPERFEVDGALRVVVGAAPDRAHVHACAA